MTILEKKIRESIKPYMGMPVALSGGIDSSLLSALLKPKFVISVELPGDEKYNEIKYSKKVSKHLGLEQIIVKLDESKFKEYVETAVLAIGRPIPHFNIFPLFVMYKTLYEMGGIKDVVLGDGPDEVMSGYARDLIANYLYKIYEFEAFENYHELIDTFLKPEFPISMLHYNIEMRKDMDDMSDGIAKYFHMKNHRPYQDDKKLDNFMKDLPDKEKIYNVEYGKYALRKIAEKYLPKEIAWRKKKVGGPVYPINIYMGWDKKCGEFGKEKWIQYQEKILQGFL